MDPVFSNNASKIDQKESSAIQTAAPIDFLLNAAAQPLAVGPSAIGALLELNESVRGPDQCRTLPYAQRLESFANFAKAMLKKFGEIEAVVFFGSAARGKAEPKDIDVAFVTAADYKYMTPCANHEDYEQSLPNKVKNLLRNTADFSICEELRGKRVDDNYFPHRPIRDVDGSSLDPYDTAPIFISGPFLAVIRDGKVPKLVASTTAVKYQKRGYQFVDPTDQA